MKLVNVSPSQGSLTRKALSAVAIITCGSMAYAEIASTELEAPILLKSIEGKIIDTPYFSVPTVADIDGDGKNDLLVGQFMNFKTPDGGSAGTVRWYRNESADDAPPTYASGANLKSASSLLYAANW